MTDLISELQAALGNDGVLTGDAVTERAEGFVSSDPCKAIAILRPRSTEEVSAALKICYAHDQNVVPFGGGTSLVQGSLSGPDEVLLTMERLNQIEKIDPTTGAMIVGSGVILQNAQVAARDAGFLFPYDLAARGSCTIGGNISTNAGGNKVLRYGMTRENILGLEVVLADGRIVSSMYEILKNNTGLDIKQLFIGGEGLFGIVTRAVIRLRPQTSSRETAMVAVDDYASLMKLLSEVQRRFGSSLSSFEVMWKNYMDWMCEPTGSLRAPLAMGHTYYVLFEVEGNNAAQDHAMFEEVLGDLFNDEIVVDGVIAQSKGEADALWEIRDGIDGSGYFQNSKWFDVSMAQGLMQDYLDETDAKIKSQWPECEMVVFGHLADGNLHVGLSIDDESSKQAKEAIVYEGLVARQGSISAEHGIGMEKREYLQVSRSETEIEILKSIKQLLDPKNILNRGKVFPPS